MSVVKFIETFTYNFLIPDSDFFQGASSGSYGSGPCTGASSSTGLGRMKTNFYNNRKYYICF